MDGLVCDCCGRTLLLDEDVRYVLRVEGFAAYDPMEITQDDLDHDFESEMRDLLERLSQVTPGEAQDEVYRAMRFDLCPLCWRRFLRDPLAGGRPAGQGEGEGEGNGKEKSQGN